MSKHIEVIYNLLFLLETIEEGLNHMEKQLSELRYEEAFVILQDVVQGIISIDDALTHMEDEFKGLKDDSIKQAKQKLNQFISQAVGLYEEEKYQELEKEIHLVLDAFIAWSKYIQSVVKSKNIS